MQFQHSIKKNKLKRRREIKKMNIKRWSEYVIKSIDMNLCICKNKKNYYLIMYASDLMIYELRCIYAVCNHKSLYVLAFRLFDSTGWNLYVFIYFTTIDVFLLSCSRILIVYFFLFTKSVMSLMNFFLMQIYFFSFFLQM